MKIKHTVNGDRFHGWYCYQCNFWSRDVVAAAEHDGLIEPHREENTVDQYKREFREEK